MRTRPLILGIALFFVGILSIGFSIFYTQSITMLNNAGSLMVYPLVRLSHGVVSPLQTLYEQRQSCAQLRHALQTTQEECENLRKELTELKALARFDTETKAMREFATRYEHTHMTLCHVLLRTFTDHAHFFIVDKGSRHGIKPDMVAVYKNNLIGRVSHVYPYYSKVTLATDKNCSIAAYCSRTAAHGIHEGTNNDTQTTVRYVSHLSSVKEGDWVLSRGDGLIFPQGFVLGSIEQAHKEDLYYTITVKPFVNFHTLHYCYLLQKSSERS